MIVAVPCAPAFVAMSLSDGLNTRDCTSGCPLHGHPGDLAAEGAQAPKHCQVRDDGCMPFRPASTSCVPRCLIAFCPGDVLGTLGITQYSSALCDSLTRCNGFSHFDVFNFP